MSLRKIKPTKNEEEIITFFIDPHRPVWEFEFENVDAEKNLNNSGVDPSSLSLKLNEGKLIHHPSRRGKVLLCDRKYSCIDTTTFNPDSEAGKCMK